MNAGAMIQTNCKPLSAEYLAAVCDQNRRPMMAKIMKFMLVVFFKHSVFSQFILEFGNIFHRNVIYFMNSLQAGALPFPHNAHCQYNERCVCYAPRLTRHPEVDIWPQCTTAALLQPWRIIRPSKWTTRVGFIPSFPSLCFPMIYSICPSSINDVGIGPATVAITLSMALVSTLFLLLKLWWPFLQSEDWLLSLLVTI